MEWIVLSLIVIAVAAAIVIGLKRRPARRERISTQPDIAKAAHAAMITEAQARSRARTVDPGAINSG